MPLPMLGNTGSLPGPSLFEPLGNGGVIKSLEQKKWTDRLTLLDFLASM